MNRRAESLNHAGSRRLAESNRCRLSETEVSVNQPERGCPRCHGDGVITIAAYAGLRRDPENDHDERCPDCAGSGERTQACAGDGQ